MTRAISRSPRAGVGMLALVATLAACGGATPRGGGGGSSGGGSGAGAGDVATTPDAAPAVDWAKAGIDWSTPPAPGPEPAFVPPVPTSFTLASGARVLLLENRRLPLVSVRVVFDRAGSREDGAQAGLARLTADLLDEGAGDRDALALAEAVEELGASLGAGAGADAATVGVDTLAATLDDGLALLADVLLRPRFSEADVARVKADTLEDLKQLPQEPRRVAGRVFDQLVYGAHPYGSPGGGTLASVGALTRADVVAFWKRRYVPAHATLVVAGDVDRATLETLLTRRLGGWKGKPLPAARRPTPPAAAAPTLVFVDRPGAPQSVVMIGRRAGDAADAAQVPLDVLNTAVGGSFAARLNNRLREQLGYTYGMSSAFSRGDWGGKWTVTSSLKTAVTADGLREALAIVDAARAAPLPDDELAKARQLMTRQLPQGFETNAELAGSFASLVERRRPLDWYQGYAAAVAAVTPAQAQALAAAAWSDLSIVVVGDWAAVGASVAALGLPVQHRDADGKPVERR